MTDEQARYAALYINYGAAGNVAILAGQPEPALILHHDGRVTVKPEMLEAAAQTFWDAFRNPLADTVRDLRRALAEASQQYERAPETSRRKKAVEALLALGWEWRDGEWIAPRNMRADSVDRLQLTRDASLWRVLLEHITDVSVAPELTDGRVGVMAVIPSPPGIDLTDYAPDLTEIVQALAMHSLATEHGISL